MRPSECPRCGHSRMLPMVIYIRELGDDKDTRWFEYTCAFCRLTYSEEEESWKDEHNHEWEPPR